MVLPIEHITNLLAPLLEGTDIFVVSLKIKPTNNIKLYLEADSGFTVEKSISINRRLARAIEATGIFPEGDFSLEVSSPGLDAPLVLHRQYVKNIGKTVSVTDNNDVVVTGVLTEVNPEAITLSVKPVSKKEVVVNKEISFNNIKKTIVEISF